MRSAASGSSLRDGSPHPSRKLSTHVVERLSAALRGRYEVEREIGGGGIATVYLARDLRHNRCVALEVLKPELAAVVGAERFLTEIETHGRKRRERAALRVRSGMGTRADGSDPTVGARDARIDEEVTL